MTEPSNQSTEARLSFEFVDVVKSDRYIDSLARDIIINPDQVPIHFLPQFSSFFRSSNYHGRSFEDPHQHAIRAGDIVDENDDVYRVVTIKGANTPNVNVQYAPHEPNQVRVNGMLDSSTFPRVQAISEHLRREGVLTEWPVYHARPKLFPIWSAPSRQGQEPTVARLSQTQFMDGLAKDYEAVFSEPGNRSKRAKQLISVGQYGAALQGLIEFRSGVMYRAMLSNVRLAEINEFTPLSFMYSVSSAILALQDRKPDHLWTWEQIAALDPFDVEDQHIYLNEILPKIMGDNLAMLHNAGAQHRYPHAGNWTLAGELVDLDSVSCGDIFEDDKAKVDMARRFADIDLVIEEIVSIHEDSEIFTDPVEFVSRFTNLYFSERNLSEDISKQEQIIIDTTLADQPEVGINMPYPEIIKFSSSETADMIRRLTAALLKSAKSEGTDRSPIDQCLGEWYEKAQPQVDDYFANVDLWTLPEFVDLEKIARIEVQRQYSMLVGWIMKRARAQDAIEKA